MNSRPEPSSDSSRSETSLPADAVDDAQRFDAAAVHVREHTDVVARGERMVHALEPFLGLGAERDADAEQQRRSRRHARPSVTAHRRLLRRRGRLVGGLFDHPTAPLGIGGDQAEQRHAARQRSGIFAVRDDVIREARRRRDAGGRARRGRDVTIGLAVRHPGFGGRRGIERDDGAGGFRREHDGFGDRVAGERGLRGLPGRAARRWKQRRRPPRCWRRRPDEQNASSAPRRKP